MAQNDFENKRDSADQKIDLRLWKRLIAYAMRHRRTVVSVMLVLLVVAGIDLAYPQVNTRRGRVGRQTAHTLTTDATQGTLEPRPVRTPLVSSPERNPSRTGKPGAPMFTLTTKDRHGVLLGKRIRRLTPRECLRLQGWRDEQIDRVLAIQSDNQVYKQAGNGVTVTVVEAIGRRLAAVHNELEAMDKA